MHTTHTNSACSLSWSNRGAQLLSWAPAGMESVLWLSPLAFDDPTRPIRGGIPLCFPWFGNAGTPSHGFARRMEWELVRRTDYAHESVRVFRLEDSPETRAIWDHAFCAELRMIVGEECDVDLEVEGDVEFTAALHSYFHVGDIEQVIVTGLGPEYRDSLQKGRLVPEKYNGVKIDREVDRIYVHPDPIIRIWDEALDRVIEIVQNGHSDTVLWNPWAKKSASLNDMPENAYRNMLCVETAAISKPLRARPGKPATLSVRILANPLG